LFGHNPYRVVTLGECLPPRAHVAPQSVVTKKLFDCPRNGFWLRWGNHSCACLFNVFRYSYPFAQHTWQACQQRLDGRDAKILRKRRQDEYVGRSEGRRFAVAFDVAEPKDVSGNA
jgi:hypothetical protein